MNDPSAARPIPALALRGIARAHGRGRRRIEVLRGVDLELGRGKTLGLVGPNGSGKTTLLRIAAGIERPSAGTVHVLGGAPDVAAHRARVGYLSEDSPFPPELSAREALRLAGALQGLARKSLAAQAEAMLERVGLAGSARRALGRFSKGMLRRFGLAQAFLHQPDLVLLDEPTAGLDAPGFLVLEELLAEARERGAAIVLCSHVLADVLAHGDALLVLVRGRVAAFGPPLGLARAEARVRLEVEGLDAPALDELERWIGGAGGRVLSRGPASATLLEIYGRLDAAG